MVSPLIDENVMVQYLQLAEKDAPAAERLRSGAAMLLIDAFDRDITRDQFLAALGAAVQLIDAAAKHEMMTNVKAFQDTKGAVSNVDIEVTLHSVRQIMDVSCAQCVKMAGLLKECPLDEDPIH